MKRKTAAMRIAAIAMLMLAVGTAGAEDAPWFGTHYQQGALIATLPVSLEFTGGFGVGTVPGVEYVFTKVRPANVFSIDLTGGVRGLANFWTARTTPTYGSFTVGAAGTFGAHFGLRGLPGDIAAYMDRLDFYTAIGVGYLVAFPTGSWPTGTDPGAGLVWGNFSGINYYFSDSLAVNVGTNYFSSILGGGVSSFSTSIGVTFKTGPAEELGDRPDFALPDMSGLAGSVQYANFLTFFALTGAYAGFGFDDESYEPGTGVRFVQRYRDSGSADAEEIEYTRILLRREADGETEWRFSFFAPGTDEEFIYEATFDAGYELSLLEYLDENGEVQSLVPEDTYAFADSGEYASVEERGVEFVRTETVRVPAGRFRADLYSYTEDDLFYRWWLSDDVPGRIVKVEFVAREDVDASGEPEAGAELSADGELLEVITGYRSPW